jgi:hypothetical protein
MRQLLSGLVLAFVLVAACTPEDDREPGSNAVITIPDLTGLSRSHAIGLIDNLDLEIRIQRVDVTGIDSETPSPGFVIGGQFAGDAVLRQDPPPDTRVSPGATITLFVPYGRPLRPGEKKFRLLTHCGLGYPLEFENEFWLPSDPELKRTINTPEGFASDGYYDNGTIRRIDDNTLIYTSATGIAVEYEPTSKRPPGCQ